MKVFKILTSALMTVTVLTAYAFTVPQSSQQMPYKNFTLETLNFTVEKKSFGSTFYLNLTSIAVGSMPMGLIYDSHRNVVWVALHPEYSNPNNVFGVIKINPLTLNLTVYRFPWQVDENYYGPASWTFALDSNWDLWISIRSYCVTPNHPPSTIPYLAKLNPETSLLTIYYTPTVLGGGNHIIWDGNFIWYLTVNALSKVNISSDSIEKTYFTGKEGVHMVFDKQEGTFWVSFVEEGTVSRFNVSSEKFDVNVTGFDRPRGLFVDSSKVYVAESSSSVSRISVIDKSTLTVERINTGAAVTNEGTQFVLKSTLGNIWWTDNSNHYGAILINKTKVSFQNISPYGLFIDEIGGSIWISAKGSAFVTITQDIQVAVEGAKGGRTFKHLC